MLHIDHISKHFGSLIAVKDVTLNIKKQEIVGLIGSNGSGKTTLFNLIAKVLPATKGKIYFQDKCLNKLTPYKICRLGIARTHQVPIPFKSLTVRENIELASFYGNNKANKNSKELSNKILSNLHNLLSLAGLDELASKPSYILNDVQCKMLELIRSLSTAPKLLLLDEILAGFNPSEEEKVKKIIFMLRDKMDITIFWIEHHMNAIMTVCDRVICIDHGEIIFDGSPKEASADKRVITSYLGTDIG